MSRLGRVGRRPDHWDSPHDRARLRVAERMAGDLGTDEAAWLDEHLAGCDVCRSVATQYAADRATLRTLRDEAPEPPRDLWARTAAAIEHESRGRRTEPGRATARRSRVPLGAWSGIAVVVLVVGVATLSGTIDRKTAAPQATAEETSGQVSTTGGDAGSEPVGAQATPFAVGAGRVEWVDKSANGGLAYNNASVGEVCPAEGTAGCPTLQDADQQTLSLRSAPRTIISSPNDDSAVMVADDGSGGDQIIVFDLPTPTPPATPAPMPTPAATPAPTPTPMDTHAAGPVSSPSPSTAPSSSPSASLAPIKTPEPDTFSPIPSATPIPAQPTPSLTPAPTVAASLAIASDIQLVGESAAFSADGSWFAFTARPANASRGPDVYVWHVGDTTAHALTTDGSTVFASWDGDQLVASRPAAVASDATAAVPVTVHIDPSSGQESPAGDVWHPVVDPTRSRAVGWTGSLKRSADGTTWTPDIGKLEMRPWSDAGTRYGAAAGQRDGLVVSDAAAAGFDVRWDEAGDWVAIWVADAADPTVGRLSLYHVDATRGRLELPKDAPTGVAALPGFSIGEGRLAWATPPGQDGEGSRIQIVAWNDDGVGSVESAPGEDLIVIR